MVTKGIVEEVLDKYSIKVRLPIIDGMQGNKGAVSKDDLSVATICSMSDTDVNTQVGDIVYVTFEDNDIGRPIILGTLYRKNMPSNSNVDIRLSTLGVKSTAILPTNTRIGDVDYSEIRALKNIKSNIQKQIDAANYQLDTNTLQISKLSDQKVDKIGIDNIQIKSSNPYIEFIVDKKTSDDTSDNTPDDVYRGYIQAYNIDKDKYPTGDKLGVGYGWDKSIKIDIFGNLEVPENIKSKTISFGISEQVGALNSDGSITERGQLLEDKYLTKIEAGKFGTADWSATQDTNGNLVFKYK